jgi:uncharacterized membrane protein
MDIDNRKILIAIVAITMLSLPVAFFTTGLLRIVLGVLFVLFFPGYALLSAIFPRQGSLGGIERIALSFGLSIAVVPLIGLIMNYTPWGISFYPIVISVALFIVIASAVAWYRLWALPPKKRFSVAIGISLPRWGKMGGGDRVLYACLGLAVVVAIGTLGYVIAVPQQGERFTEFYILSAEGKAEDYPGQAVVGEPVELTVGIVNHEYQALSYRIAVAIDGVENKEITTGELAHQEKWERVVSFVPQSSGEGQRVEFWLYRNAETEPCFEEPLRLYIDVTE